MPRGAVTHAVCACVFACVGLGTLGEDVGLFCGDMGFFYRNVRLFCGDLELVCKDMGLCCVSFGEAPRLVRQLVW